VLFRKLVESLHFELTLSLEIIGIHFHFIHVAKKLRPVVVYTNEKLSITLIHYLLINWFFAHETAEKRGSFSRAFLKPTRLKECRKKQG